MSKSVFARAGLLLALVALGCIAPSTPTPREVSFSGYAGLKLQGTLLMPDGAGPHPAMLLLPGSGPTDRDGNQLPALRVDMLKDFAEALAQRGVATLRFDKRAVGARYAASYPTGLAALDDFFSYDAFVADAKAGFDFLKVQEGIDPKRVGVLGHSEGGLIALSLAPTAKPAALVLVSTAGRELGQVIVEQVHEGFGAQFMTPQQNKTLTTATARIIDAIRTTKKVPGDVPAELRPLFPAYLSKYLSSVLTLKPASLAASYKGRVLVVQGQKDVQVSAKRDAPALFGALAKGSAELFLVPDATHCMKKYVGPADPGFTGPTLPGVLDKVATWTSRALANR